MKNSILSFALTFALTLALMPIGAFAKGFDHDRMFKPLNLTPAQKEQLTEIRKGQKEKFMALREKIKKSREELNQKLQSDATDDDLKKSFNALQALTAEKHVSRFDKVLAIRKILTPEQRAKFKTMHKEFRDRRGKKCDHAEEGE